ncbi:hypothetical protein ABZ461_37150 [Actinacidiphila glaucinigra]|uniref:hypothetical protein n=1 Tax=Actinacidiphila glaucinigra TaxID=235986 RepID=UPI0033DE2E56
MASWTAAHTTYGVEHPAGARLQLALPPGTEEAPAAAWRLRTVDCAGPEAFRLRTAAFRGRAPSYGQVSRPGPAVSTCTRGPCTSSPATAGARRWTDGGGAGHFVA